MGDGIDMPDGVWTFGGTTPSGFDSHIARSIPGYHDCHELILDIADELVPARGRCYDLGCSTGALTARLAERLGQRGVEVIGVDREPAMIERAAERCAGLPAARVMAGAMEQLAVEPADLVICVYSLQFVAPRHRAQVLGRLHAALEPEGALILFEKVLAPSARAQSVADQALFEFKRRRGFSNDEIAEKARGLRGVLQPFTASQNYALLRDAGFREITHVFRWLTFDGVIAFA